MLRKQLLIAIALFSTALLALGQSYMRRLQHADDGLLGTVRNARPFNRRPLCNWSNGGYLFVHQRRAVNVRLSLQRIRWHTQHDRPRNYHSLV
jgi:hypothetical protein